MRGDKDSIRRLGAKGRATVEVELEFRLGTHEYRVTRGLSSSSVSERRVLVTMKLRRLFFSNSRLARPTE